MEGIWRGILLLCTVMQASSGQMTPTDQLLAHLQQLAKRSVKIPGPKSLTDRIAIVGGGPAGIHMAYRLKKAGFTNVKVFEQSGEVGGKSRSVYHRGVPQEMGTCCTQPDYGEIYDLIREHDAGDIVSMPYINMWVDTARGKVPVPMTIYYTLEVRKLRPDLANDTATMFFQSAIQKYIRLHRSLFGQYEGLVMPRPSRAVLAATNMTFLDFLRKHDIEIMKAVFLPAGTMSGYGHVDEISALYALMWLTPNFILQSVASLQRDTEEGTIKMLSKGFQFIWLEMTRQHNLNVKLNSPVLGIIRSATGFTLIYKDCSNWRFENFDFLVLTPAMKSLSNIIRFNTEEISLFQKSFHYYMITSLVDTTYGRRGESPRGYYADNIRSKIDNLVCGVRDSYASLKHIVGTNYSSGIYPGGSDGRKIQSSIYYQLPQSKPDEAIAERMLRDHVNYVHNARVLRVQEQIVWHYFPRYSVTDMATGILWDIFDMQGKYGIWYIGSSVSFESLNGVIGYNNMLLKHVDFPKM